MIPPKTNCNCIKKASCLGGVKSVDGSQTTTKTIIKYILIYFDQITFYPFRGTYVKIMTRHVSTNMVSYFIKLKLGIFPRCEVDQTEKSKEKSKHIGFWIGSDKRGDSIRSERSGVSE